MTRRRRALALAALAVVLGALAAADVAGREAQLQRRLGRPIPVVVARGPLVEGRPLRTGSLAIRQIPSRYAPAGSFGRPEELVGRAPAVDLPPGTAITSALLQTEDDAVPQLPVGEGRRITEVIAHGSPDLVVAGTHVDVLVTTERRDGQGSTRIALSDAEVLTAAPQDADDQGPRVRIGLSTSVEQAVALAQAQNFAREIRVLPRAAG